MSTAITQSQEWVSPTHLDLPHTDDKPVESSYQPFQAMLLTSCLTPVLDRLYPDSDYFVGADTGIYWRLTKPPERGCRAPDWFYVGNVPRLLDGILRKSYVLWQESVAPPVVVEFVSGDGTEERDATPYDGKFWVYERAIKAPYYAIWYPIEERLEVFELRGTKYRPLPADSNGRFRIPPLEVDFGIWEGEYLGNPGPWLRVWDSSGQLLPTAEETNAREKQRADMEKQRAEAEKQRAEAEKQRANAEKQRADALASKLREFGVDPDRI